MAQRQHAGSASCELEKENFCYGETSAYESNSIQSKSPSVSLDQSSSAISKRVTFSPNIRENSFEAIDSNILFENSLLESGILKNSTKKTLLFSNKQLNRTVSCSAQDADGINSITFPEKSDNNKTYKKRWFACFPKSDKNGVKQDSDLPWKQCAFYDNFLEQVAQPNMLLKCAKQSLNKLKVRNIIPNRTFTCTSFEEVFSLENVFNWSSFHVCAWLKLIGLEQYAERFLINGVDGSTLLELSRSHFKMGLGVNDEDHLTSLQIGVVSLLVPRKGRVLKKSFFEEWSLDKTLSWLVERGFGVLKVRFREKAIHGAMLLFVNLDYLIDKVIDIASITSSSVVKASLKATIQQARVLESAFFKGLGKCKRARRTSSSGENNVLSWNIPEIENWLKSVNVGHKITNFKDHCVNGTILLDLDYDMMKEMGLSEILSIVLMKALRYLKREKIIVKKNIEKGVTGNEEDCVGFRNFATNLSNYKARLEEIRRRSLSDTSLENETTTLSCTGEKCQENKEQLNIF